MTPTSEENKARINVMFESVADQVAYLAARWKDEGQYEDIADYKKAIEGKIVDKGIVITKMNKKPFGFNFTIGTEAEYRLYAKGRSVGWERLK